MQILTNTYGTMPLVQGGNLKKMVTEVEKNEDTVALFTTGCPKCNVLKQKLDAQGILYTENNSKEQMNSLGITQVPTLKVGERMLTFVEANDWLNTQKG